MPFPATPTTGSLVGAERLVGSFLALVPGRELGQVAKVVTLHLVVEDLALTGLSVLDQVVIEDGEDIVANLGQLLFNLDFVRLDLWQLLLVALGLFLLLNGGDYTPASSTSTDHILVRNREQVALLDGELVAESGHLFHVFDHF